MPGPALRLPSYLTAGGGTLTLTHAAPDRITMSCSGCLETRDAPARQAESAALYHADTCRVIPQPEPWPDGVLARATTYGGARIDITLVEGDKYLTCCTGCSASQLHPFTPDPRDHSHATAAYGDAVVWVHRHATCPFEPRPA